MGKVKGSTSGSVSGSDTKHLQQRDLTWYVTVDVPQALRSIIKKRKIIKSLKTRDLRHAQRLRHAAVAEIFDEFDQARAVQRGEPAALRQADRKRFEELLAAHRAELAEEAANLPDDYDPSAADAPMTISESYSEAIDDMVAHREYGPALDALCVAYQEDSGLPTSVPAYSRLTFSEAAAGYLADQRRDQQAKSTEQTLAQAASVFRLFSDYSDDPPIHQVDKKLIAGFLDQAKQLHPDWGRSPKTKGRSFKELLALSRSSSSERICNKTLNRYVAALRSVWKWAQARGHVDETINPFSNTTFKVPEHRKTAYLPYNYVAELRTLLTSFSPDIDPRPHTIDSALSWITWIAAYSGMRMNEICSLTLADIQDRDGVTVMVIDEAKTAAGDRLVPVHSKLISMGFLAYVEHLKATDHPAVKGSPSRRSAGRSAAPSAAAGPAASLRSSASDLWPALRPGGPDGKPSWYLSKRFTVLRRHLDITRERLTFHSLRANVATALERAGVPESEAVQLLGHERKSMSYGRYSSGLAPADLQRVVERIAYPGL